MTSFTGFPIEGLKFLNALKENNNREWFNQHKSDYVKYVQGPAQDFVVVLGAKLKAISAGLQFDPSLSGSGSVMRIYRDIRFSKDKTPYKTYQGIRFWEGISRKEMFSGIYIGIDENGAGMYLGRYEFPKEILLAFRKAVDDEDTGKELEAVISKVRSYAIA